VKKGSGSGTSRGTSPDLPGTQPDAKAKSTARPQAIQAEPTQSLDLSRLDDSGAFDDVETHDAEAARVDADWQQELHDVDDAALDGVELADAGVRQEDDIELIDDADEPSEPTPAVEASTRFDVSDAVLEEVSLPRHLAATAKAVAYQPLVEPLFDNQPTQHAPEELRAALLKRTPKISSSAPIVSRALASSQPAANQPTPQALAAQAKTQAALKETLRPVQVASPFAATLKPQIPAAGSKPAVAAQAAAPKPAVAAQAAAPKPAAEPHSASAQPEAKLAQTKPSAGGAKAPMGRSDLATIKSPGAAGTSAAGNASPVAGVADRAPPVIKSSAAGDGVVSSRLGARDVTLVELGGDSPKVIAQKSVANNPTIVAMAPLVAPAVASGAASSAQAPASAEPGVTGPSKPALSPASTASVGSSKATAAVPVPASLLKSAVPLKKDLAPLSVGGDRSAESRGAAAPQSGATFVLPVAKDAKAAALQTRTRQPAAESPPAQPAAAGSGASGGGGGGGRTTPPGAGGPPADALRRSIEGRVVQRARDFSLPALLDVLEMLDYRPDEIEFGGVLSYGHPSSLVQSVQFISAPRRMVHVALNMGLLSAQSPLPSYFLKYAENMEGDSLIEFLGYFDHHLLKRRAAALYPERDRTLFADWAESQAQLLQLVGLTAPSTLYWLFQRVYPELGIEVRRSTEHKPLSAEGVVLGNAKLGEACAFGGGTTVPVGGLEVTLYSEEETTPTGLAWPVEASQRLRRQVFSALGETDVYLTVHLVILEQSSWLAIEDERYLGFEPLWEDLRGELVTPPTPAGPRSTTPVRTAAPIHESSLQARSRAAFRIHQVQLFSGPIRSGKETNDASAQSAIA
jgi:hypothetical protein